MLKTTHSFSHTLWTLRSLRLSPLSESGTLSSIFVDARVGWSRKLCFSRVWLCFSGSAPSRMRETWSIVPSIWTRHSWRSDSRPRSICSPAIRCGVVVCGLFCVVLGVGFWLLRFCAFGGRFRLRGPVIAFTLCCSRGSVMLNLGSLLMSRDSGNVFGCFRWFAWMFAIFWG